MAKIAIIGAGAAGLMAAITASKDNNTIHIYEQNDRVAKKILASGNGRCNISNKNLSSDDYFGTNPKFCKYALESFSFSHFQKFCKNIGLMFNILEDGRAYPLSNEAKSVASSFESYALSLGVKIINSEKITNIEKIANKFYLRSQENKSQAYDKLLICTGSEAAPQLGGCDSGYKFAQSLGHSVMPSYPSLVQLHLNSNLHVKMSGSKQDAVISLYINRKKEQSIQGDILFTKYGISGFAILDISQMASESLLNFLHVEIGLDLLPSFDRQALSSLIISTCRNIPDFSIETVLTGMLPKKISSAILEDCKLDKDLKASKINPKIAKQLTNKIKDWRFEVSDTHGFKHAEVSGGGVNTDEIDDKTMESKLCKNLYFAGEVLDIVGRRGGYNFHFAWSSGYLAAKSMA